MLLQLCALVALPVAAPLLQPTARRAPRLTRLRAVGNEALSAKSWEAVGASAEMVGAAVACGAGDGPTRPRRDETETVAGPSRAPTGVH